MKELGALKAMQQQGFLSCLCQQAPCQAGSPEPQAASSVEVHSRTQCPWLVPTWAQEGHHKAAAPPRALAALPIACHNSTLAQNMCGSFSAHSLLAVRGTMEQHSMLYTHAHSLIWHYGTPGLHKMMLTSAVKPAVQQVSRLGSMLMPAAPNMQGPPTPSQNAQQQTLTNILCRSR